MSSIILSVAETVPLLLIVMFFGIAFAAPWRGAGSEWLRFARESGLRIQRGGRSGPILAGDIGQDSVHIRRETRQHNRDLAPYHVTIYRYSYAGGARFGFQLERQGLWQTIKGLLGFRDIEVGDAGFDQEVLVRGARARELIAYLTPERKARIRQMLRIGNKVEIRRGSISLERDGIDSAAEIRLVLDRLQLLADALRVEREPTSGPNLLDKAVVAQREGRLSEAKEMLTEARRSGTPEIEVAAVEHELSGTVPEDLPELELADPIPAEVETTKPLEPAPPAEAPVEPKAPVEPEPPLAAEATHVDTPLDQQATCNRLFSPRLMSHEAQELFDAEYSDREVTWTGQLVRVESFRFDLVFGDEPGTRAVFEIGEVGGEIVLARTVQAIVQLPADSIASLEQRTGQLLRFRGRLTRCDAFVRNLYVREGRILDGG